MSHSRVLGLPRVDSVLGNVEGGKRVGGGQGSGRADGRRGAMSCRGISGLVLSTVVRGSVRALGSRGARVLGLPAPWVSNNADGCV